MTETDGKNLGESDSFWHRRRPGMRYAYSASAIIGGVIIAFGSASGVGADTGGTWLFIIALALVFLGLVSIPVFW